jgi:hypothetical protein
MSPDPYIPDPTNMQDYNRRSYVRDNPLSFIDPSGSWHNNGRVSRAINLSGGTDANPCIPRVSSARAGRSRPMLTPLLAIILLTVALVGCGGGSSYGYLFLLQPYIFH